MAHRNALACCFNVGLWFCNLDKLLLLQGLTLNLRDQANCSLPRLFFFVSSHKVAFEELVEDTDDGCNSDIKIEQNFAAVAFK